MEILTLDPKDKAILFDSPNDYLFFGPCRMSMGGTKKVGARMDMGTMSPSNLHGTGPRLDRSQEYTVQECIFEDMTDRKNIMLYPGHRQ